MTIFSWDASADTFTTQEDHNNMVDLALKACTTLVSFEPKLTIETHNYVMKAMLCFSALPNEPSDVVDPLIDNLTTLLCVILSTCGEDGRSRAEQLLHILKQIDQDVCSPVEHQRKRGCRATQV
ncbi:hypothetical protein RJ641_025176 [Dillenia turbinata]|uniref:Uncharacterized protein n=1 Tax=Dillenia turbinata TaxID=194707 RepID=A0AAN8W6E3_9MAGN